MDTGTETPPQAGSSSSLSAFVKSMASFNGDLSSLTAPPSILSPTSLTEYSSYWCEHPWLFAAPAKEADPKKRALLVLKWFLSTLKQQYASRNKQYGKEKKPLNPFLGELFLGKWTTDGGTTELISEQVCHHPPVTAYCITDQASKVRLEGYNAQKASFSGTINIKQIGHAILTVPVPNSSDVDTYLITLPSLHIEGIIFGSPSIKLDGASYISSSTGYTAKIDYSGQGGQGWFGFGGGDKKNSVAATLYKTGKDKEVLYSVTGQWTEGFEIREGSAKSGKLVESYNSADEHAAPLDVAKDQHPLESRRAWAKVANAIKAEKVDLEVVGTEKAKIENAQREMRAKEKAEGRMWQRRYFSVRTDPDPVLAELGPHVGLPDHGDSDKTGGVWRFDPAKAEKARSQPLPSAEEAKKIAHQLLGQ